MSLKESPIAKLSQMKSKAVGFFLNTYKRISVVRPRFEGKRSQTEIVAVDLGHSHLLVAAMKRKPEGAEISHFRVEPRPTSTEGVADRLKAIFKEEGLNQAGVRTALKSAGIVIRILRFPQMRRTELASMLQYEVEKYIPFKSSEVILDFEILNENIPQGDLKMMDIILVAVKQREVKELCELFQAAGIAIGLIDVGAFAFANFLELSSQGSSQGCLAFLDMGADSSAFGVMLRGKPVFIRDISFGGTDVLKLLKRKLGLDPNAVVTMQESRENRPPEYKIVVEQALCSLVNEVKLSLGYYLDHVGGAEPIQILYIAGGGFRLLPDPQYLENELRTSVKRPDILSRLKICDGVDSALLKSNEDLLPGVLGLCLRQ